MAKRQEKAKRAGKNSEDAVEVPTSIKAAGKGPKMPPKTIVFDDGEAEGNQKKKGGNIPPPPPVGPYGAKGVAPTPAEPKKNVPPPPPPKRGGQQPFDQE